MGGFFGATSRRNCILDVFFGTDYHSHLGTRRGGMAAWDKEVGMQREIHNIQNSPFRTKFEGILDEMTGPPPSAASPTPTPSPFSFAPGWVFTPSALWASSTTRKS